MNKSLESIYSYRRKRLFYTFSISLIILIASIIISLIFGASDISFSDLLKMVRNFFSPSSNYSDTLIRKEKILFLLRFPRLILGLFVGLSLSVCGASMQSITRNPLVSPFTIGLSSAASFGASIAIVLGFNSNINIVMSAYIFALICSVIVYYFALKLGMTPQAIVLVGISISYLFSALSLTIKFIANESQLSNIVQWTFGSLNSATWLKVTILFIISVFTLPILFKNAWNLNVLSTTEDDYSKSLGVNTKRVRIIIGLVTVLLSSAVVAFSGVIGFVGLVSPHISRYIVGNDYRYLIPYSMIIGAILVTVSDTIGRIIIAPAIVPVGIIISYIGVPIFINLIFRRGRDA